MSSRAAVALYDPALAREATQAELRAKAAPQKLEINKMTHSTFEMPTEAKARAADAFAKEMANINRRIEERRRRDPTFRPDALDLDRSKMLRFNRYVDYYALLGVEQFASPADLKDAFRRQSLLHHPDKQLGKSVAERVAADERFHAMAGAHRILAEPATRQAYDKARDRLTAQYEAGVVPENEMDKPPPTCVEVGVTLAELFTGCWRHMRFVREMFKGTQWERKEDDVFKLKVRPGELEGATFWFRSQGNVATAGKADLVFVLEQAASHTIASHKGRVRDSHVSRLPSPAL